VQGLVAVIVPSNDVLVIETEPSGTDAISAGPSVNIRNATTMSHTPSALSSLARSMVALPLVAFTLSARHPMWKRSTT